MVLLEFAMYPVGKGESLSPYVARSLDIIDRSGLAYQLTPMGTILEGEWDEVMAVVKQAVDAVAAAAPRVSLVLKADIRPGHVGQLSAKVQRIEEALRD